MSDDEIYAKYLEETGDWENFGISVWDEEVRFIITDSMAYKVFQLRVDIEELFKPLTDTIKGFMKKE